MTSIIMIYCEKFITDNKSIRTHIKNPFLWLPFRYVSFIDNIIPKKSKVLFFVDCFTTEQYFEYNKVCIKNNLSIIDWTDEMLLVIESKNVNINKNLISSLRKKYV